MMCEDVWTHVRSGLITRSTKTRPLTEAGRVRASYLHLWSFGRDVNAPSVPYEEHHTISHNRHALWLTKRCLWGDVFKLESSVLAEAFWTVAWRYVAGVIWCLEFQKHGVFRPAGHRQQTSSDGAPPSSSSRSAQREEVCPPSAVSLGLLWVRVKPVLAARVFLTEVLMNELELWDQMQAHLQMHLQVLQPRLQLHKRRPAAEAHASQVKPNVTTGQHSEFVLMNL